jgi:hypothetical protein
MKPVMSRPDPMRVSCVLSVALAWLASSPAYAHSVPTHKNITVAAVGWLLDAQPRLQCTDAGKKALTDALLWGTEHEDDDYDKSDALKMGRYMFHFTPALDDQFAELPPVPIVGTKTTLGGLRDLGIFKSGCSSLQWGGFEKSAAGSVTCTYRAFRVHTITLTNDNTWGNALADAKKSSRFSGFSEGFVKLGYLIHLVQDQSSPAHALNAAHGHKALHLDILAEIEPGLKGMTVDFGFSDAMEVNPVGNDAERQPTLPPRDPGQLFDRPPAEIFNAMHVFTRSQKYRRETMSQRTERMFKNVAGRVEKRLPDVARGLGLPWPLGRETLAQEQADLKRRVANIIHEEVQKEATAEHKDTMAKSAEAAREWAVLGPEAVRLSASLLWKYINEAKPIMGVGPAACTLKP